MVTQIIVFVTQGLKHVKMIFSLGLINKVFFNAILWLNN